MSLTVARSERGRSVLTHASCTKIMFNLSSVRVSNILINFQWVYVERKFRTKGLHTQIYLPPRGGRLVGDEFS